MPRSKFRRVGKLVFTGGRGGGVSPLDTRTQIKKMFETVKEALEEAGTSMSNVIEANIYLADLNDRERHLNDIWREYYPDEETRPLRMCVQAGLGRMSCEMRVIAKMPDE